VKSSTKSKPAVEFKGYETPALRAILRDDSAPALQETLQQMLAQHLQRLQPFIDALLLATQPLLLCRQGCQVTSK